MKIKIDKAIGIETADEKIANLILRASDVQIKGSTIRELIVKGILTDPKPMKITTDKIARSFDESGLSTSNIAKLLHVSERTVQHWKAGTRNMPIAMWELWGFKNKG